MAIRDPFAPRKSAASSLGNRGSFNQRHSALNDNPLDSVDKFAGHSKFTVFGPNGPQVSSIVTGLDQLAGAAERDLLAADHAESQRFGRFMGGLGNLGQTLTELPDRAEDAAEESIQATRDDPMLQRRLQELDNARLRADEAVKQADLAIAERQDFTNNLIQTQTNSLEARIRNQQRVIQSGFDPATGEPLDPATAEQAQRNLVTQTNQQIAGIQTQIYADNQAAREGLRQNAAQTRLAAADVSVRSAQIGVDLAKFESSLRSSARTQALQAQMLGAQEYAKIAGDPAFSRVPTLTYGTVSDLLAAQQLGAGGTRGINFGGGNNFDPNAPAIVTRGAG